MGEAQDAYRAMLREHLSPRLRALGFTGSGASYELPSASHWIVLGVQASQFSTANEVSFTLNCQVVRRDLWEEQRQERPYLGARPKPNTIAGAFVWRSRIGKLMPGREDRWWSVRGTENIGSIADDVATAVRDFVLPAIHAEVSGG